MKSLKSLYRIGSGPSSSHTMGPERACKQVLSKFPNASHYKVFLFGSLALTGRGHLTDYIIKKTLGEDKTEVIFDFAQNIEHPNTFKIEVYEQERIIYSKEFISIGGGALSTDESEEEVYPFKDFSEIKQYCLDHKISLPEFVYKFEGSAIKDYLSLVWQKMIESINHGINTKGTLPGGLNVIRKANTLYFTKKDENDEIRKKRIISSYAYAVSEENASGGSIVTAPTCGSSGVLPAVLYFLQKEKNLSDAQIIDALAVASIIGNVIKQNASISGAFAGCQSEIGSACSMASAAISYLNGLQIDEIEYASEVAMEHHLGLTCDPINGLVQIPCIERNAIAALRAFDSFSLASFLTESRKISFDTIVKTMYETGKDISQEYKETSLGGLAKHYNNEK